MVSDRGNVSFECIQLLVINSHGSAKDGSVVLQVERWKREGKLVGSAKLALREYYKDKAGYLKAGKARSLSLSDLTMIRERFEEIQRAMSDGALPLPTPPPVEIKELFINEDLPF